MEAGAAVTLGSQSVSDGHCNCAGSLANLCLQDRGKSTADEQEGRGLRTELQKRREETLSAHPDRRQCVTTPSRPSDCTELSFSLTVSASGNELVLRADGFALCNIIYVLMTLSLRKLGPPRDDPSPCSWSTYISDVNAPLSYTAS